MEDNFKCNKCGAKWHEIQYKIAYTAVGQVYLDKRGEGLTCPKCGSVLIDFCRVKEDFTGIQLGKVGSMNMEQRKEFFKKRADKHAKSPQAVEEKRYRVAKTLNNYIKRTNE